MMLCTKHHTLVQNVSSKYADSVLWMAMQQQVFDKTLPAWNYQHCHEVRTGLHMQSASVSGLHLSAEAAALEADWVAAEDQPEAWRDDSEAEADALRALETRCLHRSC